VAGEPALKPGALVAPDAELAVSPEASPYVSHAGLKLEAALAAFGFDPEGQVVLDIGASTGGFTDLLISRGAVKVYAVDVGSGQLHAKLRVNPKIVSLEGTDARALDQSVIREPVSAIVADVSFISLTLVLPAALRLAAPGGLAGGASQAAIRGGKGGGRQRRDRAQGRRPGEGGGAGAPLHR
jgi:23S rRNA (cytidine1920-2'-O)/16S rRNA (cytidine1409-2'-O)-methyltransferase